MRVTTALIAVLALALSIPADAEADESRSREEHPEAAPAESLPRFNLDLGLVAGSSDQGKSADYYDGGAVAAAYRPKLFDRAGHPLLKILVLAQQKTEIPHDHSGPRYRFRELGLGLRSEIHERYFGVFLDGATVLSSQQPLSYPPTRDNGLALGLQLRGGIRLGRQIAILVGLDGTVHMWALGDRFDKSSLFGAFLALGVAL